MIDTNEILDVVKLRFYIDYLYQNHYQIDSDSNYNKQLTSKIVKDYIDPLNLDKNAKILDLGCGVGHFLNEMRSREYTNLTGITLSDEEIKICKNKDLNVVKSDFSFLSQKNGYDDESVDFICLRHALQHSPFPMISLMEYNRILKYNSKMYIEIPAPNSELKTEQKKNCYSIFDKNQLVALLQRSGFYIEKFDLLEFNLELGDQTKNIIHETYYVLLVSKKFALDIK